MTDDPFSAALSKIEALETELHKWKSWVNQGDVLAGREPRFPLGDGASATGAESNFTRHIAFSAGLFFGKPFAAAVKNILLARQASNGNQPSPASVDEIHEALVQGSFGFQMSNADMQKQSIKISLGKNSITFVKLPGTDLFGLAEWYPRATKGRRKIYLNGKPLTPRGSTAEDEEEETDEASSDQ